MSTDDARGDVGLLSLQERYAPTSVCFGCGPANAAGLRLRSLPGAAGCEATWEPHSGHEAFPGVLSGGIVSTLLDCHSNWTAAAHLMAARGSERPPVTVTAELCVRLLGPTPSGGPVGLEARVVEGESTDERVVVEGRLVAAGRATATSRATFVAVRPGHPAYDAWATTPPEPTANPARAAATSAGR